jgi:hypothetical protein
VQSIKNIVIPLAEEIEGEEEMRKIREENDYVDQIQVLLRHNNRYQIRVLRHKNRYQIRVHLRHKNRYQIQVLLRHEIRYQIQVLLRH